MKALSVRQPWAHFIVEGFKNYENRNWGPDYLKLQLRLCPVGSDFLIHASKSVTKKEYDEACAFAFRAGLFAMPAFDRLKLGGIVGITRLENIVKESSSPWFTGPIALKLKASYPLPFIPCSGQLGFFEFNSSPKFLSEAIAAAGEDAP
jgi:hypothetical protein